VLIPEENVRDLVEMPENIKNKLDIQPVKWIDQVLKMALERSPEALPDATPPVAEVVATVAPLAEPVAVITKH
jgi:ATP-dependent Lon protease